MSDGGCRESSGGVEVKGQRDVYKVRYGTVQRMQVQGRQQKIHKASGPTVY